MKLSNKNPIIVTAANDDYSCPLSIMLKSLEMNLEIECCVNVYVLFSSFSDNAKSEMIAILNSEKLKLNWIKISPDKLLELKIDGHISIATYYRLLIEETFPKFDKVIYLDADLIINRCICKIWKIGFKGRHLLAVPHASKKSGIVSGERGLPSYKVLGIHEDTRTFNAGVLILNLKLWRRDNISMKVIEYLKKYHDYVLWWDQDGLNAILYDKWLPLSAVWNVMTNHLITFSSWEDSLLSKQVYKKVLRNPAIVHYAGPSKPWLPDYVGPFQNLHFEYAAHVSMKISQPL
jgi:lipopolysaccharide biosynthesis glycosyltransferase